jgi:integral membrane sensor domain MASE1/anti-sigma regulatory factor (Ser/Thr protein kinase)
VHRDRGWLVTIGILAITYFAAARLGLTLAVVHPSATPVWPPTGIALASILLLGFRVWPGIFLGAFLANMATAGTVWTSLGIAAGNTLEGLVGAYLVTKYARGVEAFDRPHDIFKFGLLAATLGTTVSATMGVTSLALGGVARWSDFGPIWSTWWLGDAAGALVVAPLLILWSRRPGLRWGREQTLERLVFLLALLAVAWVVFSGLFTFVYATVPFLVWAAFRFGRRDTMTVIALLSVLAIWATLRGLGPFVGATPNNSLLLLQAFMGITTMVMLPLAAVVTERTRAEEDRKRLNDALQRERNILQEVLARVPTAVVLTWGPEHGIQYANEHAARLIGSPGLLSGRTAREAFSGALAVVPETLDRVFNMGESVRLEEVAIIAEPSSNPQESHHYTFTLTRVPGPHGGSGGVLVVGADMTNEVRSRRWLEQKLATEHYIAGTLQRSLLPARLPDIAGLPVAAHYAPATPEAVGGDWYDVLVLPDGRVGLAIGDVAGRGVGAAAIMGRLRHALRAYAAEGHGPGELLGLLGDLMEADEMATVFYLIVDPVTWTAHYASAGHPPALAIEPNGHTRFLEGSGLPLGARFQRGYKEHRAAVEPNTVLILYTDGLVEDTDVGIEEGLRRLEQAAGASLKGSWNDLPKRITALALQGRTPRDDVAILTLQVGVLDPGRLHMRLPAVPSSLPQIRHTFRRWLGQTKTDPDDVFAVLVAVGEACTNVIEHAYGPGDAALEVEGTLVGGQISIAVRDNGAWRTPRDGAHGGRGLHVMQRLMDNVEIQAGTGGTTVRLSRRVRQKVEA